MRRTFFALAAVASLGGSALAQAPQEKIAEFRQMLAANQQKRRLLTWLETTHVAYQGVVKVTKVSDCQFSGPSAKPQCTELCLQQAPPPGGFLRRRIAEKKEAELRAYMDSVRMLMTEYVPTQPTLIDKAYQSGNVALSPDPATGSSRLIITNYRQQGDKVTITYNPATKTLERVQVDTWLNVASAKVTLDVQFATLPNGVFYAAKKTITAESAEVVVTMLSTNFSELVQQ